MPRGFADPGTGLVANHPVRMGALVVLLMFTGNGGRAEPGTPAEASAAETAAETPAETAGVSADAAAGEDELVFPPEVEALLNETSDPEAYGGLERCISARSIRRTEVLDDRHIVFELPSKKYYLVQFKHRCQRLRPGSTVIYEPRGTQLCNLDFVRAGDNLSRGDIGPPCSIPGFHEVTREQVSLLRDTLKARRKAEVDAYKAEKAQKKKEKAEATTSDPAG